MSECKLFLIVTCKIYSDLVKSVRGWDVNAVMIYELKDSGVNENQTVFLMLNGVNIISYAYIYIYIDVLRPLTNDLWVFLFQTIDAKYVK